MLRVLALDARQLDAACPTAILTKVSSNASLARSWCRGTTQT
jgi:hypothetical protein